MYRGYKIPSIDFGQDNEYFYYVGLNIHENQKTEVQKAFRKFITSENYLNGTEIQNSWFPQINADIFICHSHSDERMAVILAGWLKHYFKITAFVDSCIWKYSDDLLKEIDNKFCIETQNGLNTIYNYTSRNCSTSHVHMMLASAISMMIDRTECVFFLNTPKSISPLNGIDNTESPWIYFEIGLTKILRENTPVRYLNETRNFSEPFIGDPQENRKIPLNVRYQVDLSHLIDITIDELHSWQQLNLENISNTKSLNSLYLLKSH